MVSHKSLWLGSVVGCLKQTNKNTTESQWAMHILIDGLRSGAGFLGRYGRLSKASEQSYPTATTVERWKFIGLLYVSLSNCNLRKQMCCALCEFKLSGINGSAETTIICR